MKRTSIPLILAGLVLVLMAACGKGPAGASSAVQRAANASAGDAAGPSSDTGPANAGQAASSDTEGLTRRVLYSLLPGEEVMQAESEVGIEADSPEAAPESAQAASADIGGIVLVLTKGEGENAKYFVFRGGKKTGPYSSLEPAMKAAYEGRLQPGPRRTPCAVFKPAGPPEGSRFEPAGVGSGSGLRFKGQSFGPYVLVYSTAVTPDGSRGYYTASNEDKAFFGCTDGRVATFGGIPGEFKFSPDGKNAAVLVEGTLSLDGMKKLTDLPPEKMAEAMKESEKRFLYTIDGRKYGPFGESFKAYSFWFASGTNDLYFRSGDDIYRNGALLFKSETFDDCGFYPSPDGKKYVLYDYEKISFSDGKSYPSPLDLAVFERGGRSIFKWLTLENKKDFVVYERAM